MNKPLEICENPPKKTVEEIHKTVEDLKVETESIKKTQTERNLEIKL